MSYSCQVCQSFSPVASCQDDLGQRIFVFMEKIIVWVADLGLRPWILGKPSELVLLLLLVSLFLLYDFHRRKKWLLGLSLVLALLFFITKHPLENEVTVLDIGQGTASFAGYAGRTVLIDVGGRVDFAAKEAWQERSRQANAERTLIPYLHSRGVDRIDSLVLTHTDTDHVGMCWKWRSRSRLVGLSCRREV